MPRKKLLFLSDAVSCSSGLGRITRDLALRVHKHLGDVYEIASVGYGGPGSSSIPFKEYHLSSIQNWLVVELPQIWADFVGDEEGILFSVWYLSRLYWLGMPQTSPDPNLRRWVETAKMKKWVYGALDAEGPNGKLPSRIAETMKGFDRVLDYSAFSSKITGSSTKPVFPGKLKIGEISQIRATAPFLVMRIAVTTGAGMSVSAELRH